MKTVINKQMENILFDKQLIYLPFTISDISDYQFYLQNVYAHCSPE